MREQRNSRLGSNSLSELLVFGKVAGVEAAKFARSVGSGNLLRQRALADEARDSARRALLRPMDGEPLAKLRDEMAMSMERGCGIYRTQPEMEETCRVIAELRQRIARVKLQDRSPAWNTEWLSSIELGFQLDVAEAIARSALERRESRGAHQRLDAGCTDRDDANYLKHTLATYAGDRAARIGWSEVVITRSPPGKRAYGAEGEKVESESKREAQHA
jgi:fumarate reductase flavoprotein subunit